MMNDFPVQVGSMYRRILRTVLLPTGLALLATACGMGTEQLPSCEYASGNLLEDPGFSTLDAPRRERAWHFSQHAGDTSFRYDAKDGTLNFVKIGSEPWGLLTQSLNTEGLKGKRVEFSAELKLDLSLPRDTHGFGYGGGLSLLAKQINLAENINKIRLSSSFDHDPHLGAHDWQRVSVVVDLPTGISFLRSGFVHKAGGKMQVRNPALRIVVAGCEPTGTGE
jgi:hypothetical protein